MSEYSLQMPWSEEDRLARPAFILAEHGAFAGSGYIIEVARYPDGEMKHGGTAVQFTYPTEDGFGRDVAEIRSRGYEVNALPVMLRRAADMIEEANARASESN